MATQLAQAYVQIIPSAKGIKDKITQEIGGENIGMTSGKGIAAGLIKAIAAAGIGAAIIKTVKASLAEGAKLEQSFGGLDTIYGDASEAAKQYAYEAAKAGISANDYAEQAVSFGASLKQAFSGDTTKAVEAANTAIMDMTDNAAKMGTPIESIQNAYSGFAKQNYTMLDNLKLGYGGTKSEMERLLTDAEKLSGVKYDISNLGDVYDAIHVVQGELGLTGAAATEAANTFSGSFGSMKASASNLLANMSLGESIKPALTQLATSTYNFLFNNFLPMIGNIVKSIPEIIGTAFELAYNWVTGINWFQLGKDLLSKVKNGIQNLKTTIPQAMRNIANAAAEWFRSINWADVGTKAITLIKGAIDILFNDIPALLGDIASTAIDLFRSVDWDAAGSAVIAFITDGIYSIHDNVPIVLKTIATNAIEWFKGIDWIGAGSAIIAFITDGVRFLMNNIPIVLKAIGNTAITWFKGVDWLGAGSKLITFITDGMRSLISNIPTALKAIGSTAWDWFINLEWVQAGIDVITKIVDGLGQMIADIPNKLIEIGTNAINAFLSVDWVQAGKDAIGNVIAGIMGKETDIDNTSGDIAESGQESFIPGWMTAGSAAGSKGLQGLASKKGAITDKAGEISTAAANAMKNTGGFYSAGQSMGDGVKRGLNSVLEKVKQAAAKIAQLALSALQSAAKIGSPSKLFRDEAGKWMALGVAVGFEKYLPVDQMVGNVRNMTDKVAAATRMAAFDAIPSVTSTATLAPNNDLGMMFESISDNLLAGTREIAAGVEKGIGKIRMVSNNRETARFIADLGFAR